MDAPVLRDVAFQALDLMRSVGFDEAQATATTARKDEVNIADNEPSLLRSTDSRDLALVGIVEGRKAATRITDVGDGALRRAIESLRAAAAAAPRDDANRVSSGQRARIVQGPQASDIERLAAKAGELLEFSRRETPKVNINEGIVAHSVVRSHTVTSGGSDLEASVGHHALGVVVTAREGEKVSSFNFSEGTCHELDRHASEYFGIAGMLRDLERQIDTRSLAQGFVGDVVLAPWAVADLLEWFLGQICDEQLIAGSSLYRDRVGEAVGSALLTLRSRFDAPGIAAISSDGFVAAPAEVLRQGVLATLTPSLYGSLKTGIAHVPTAAAGWELAAGSVPRSDLIAGTSRGALVGRLSMGNPASNGDFSGVIKNSFAIDGGKPGTALSETMISGNVARMLMDVVAVSRERLDTGAYLLPWVSIGGLHFS